VRKAEIATPPTLAAHVIVPNAVYTVAQARAALGTKATTIPREIRHGRLRAARRGGRHYLLGEWLLEWLRAGEVTIRRKAEALNPNSFGERDAGSPPPITHS
jgi:hypothetical protein